MDLELALSKPRVYEGTYIATASITKLVVHNQQTLGERLRVGQSGPLKLREGVITHPFVETNFCDERSQLAGVRGA